MGSIDFTTFRWKDETLDAAYVEVCNRYGNDPYNGTISTTSGVTQVLVGHTMTRDGANTVADWLNYGLTGTHPDARGHKWEAARAIAIASDEAFTFSIKTLTFTVDELRQFIENSVEGFDGEWARKERLRAAQEHPEHYLNDFTAAKVSEAFPLHAVHAVEDLLHPEDQDGHAALTGQARDRVRGRGFARDGGHATVHPCPCRRLHQGHAQR